MEHLFRGKRTDSKEWVEGMLVNNLFVYSENHEFKGQPVCQIIVGCGKNDSWEDICNDEECIVEVIPSTVGLWTGKVDKAGRKIFKDDRNQDGGVVVWNEDDASFCWDYPGIELASMEDEENWCEITGTIHD